MDEVLQHVYVAQRKHYELKRSLRPRAWDLALPLSPESGISSEKVRLVSRDSPLNNLC